MLAQRLSLRDTCVWKRLNLHSSKAKYFGFDWVRLSMWQYVVREMSGWSRQVSAQRGRQELHSPRPSPTLKTSLYLDIFFKDFCNFLVSKGYLKRRLNIFVIFNISVGILLLWNQYRIVFEIMLAPPWQLNCNWSVSTEHPFSLPRTCSYWMLLQYRHGINL